MNNTNNTKYTVFELEIKKSQYLILSVSFIESILSEIFKEYRYKFDENGLSFKAYGVSNIRKRLSTVATEIQCYYRDHDINEMQTAYTNLTGLRGKYKNYLFDEKENIINLSEYVDRIDIEQLNYRSKRFNWQNDLYDYLYDEKSVDFIKADTRSIMWIYDKHGNTGKSKFVKWFCMNHSKDVCKLTFGTTSQLRNSMISIGSRKVYFMDIPRTKGSEDSMSSLITLLEDLKNGFISGVMYGKYKSFMMSPPHIVIFSNMKCPTDMMSSDRWVLKEIDRKTKSFK